MNHLWKRQIHIVVGVVMLREDRTVFILMIGKNSSHLSPSNEQKTMKNVFIALNLELGWTYLLGSRF